MSAGARSFQPTNGMSAGTRAAYRGIGLAEMAAHERLLEPELAPKRRRGDGDGKRGAPFADRERRSGEHQEKAGIDRMADMSVGARDDQLMTALQLDIAAPVDGDGHARPDAEREAGEAQRRAERGRPDGEGNKTAMERGHGQRSRRGKQIGGDDERPDMRQARDDALGLGGLLRPARHCDPDGGPAGPHHYEKRNKVPAGEH